MNKHDSEVKVKNIDISKNIDFKHLIFCIISIIIYLNTKTYTLNLFKIIIYIMIKLASYLLKIYPRWILTDPENLI